MARTPEYPLGQGIGAQQHHGAGLGDRERFADSDRVRAHQVDLQFADLFTSDADIAQFADSRGNGVGHLVVGDKFVDDSPRYVHLLTGLGEKQDGAALAGHLAYGFKSQIVSVDVESIHKISSQLSVPSLDFRVSSFKL